MRFTKNATLLVISLSLVGVLVGCDASSKSSASTPPKTPTASAQGSSQQTASTKETTTTGSAATGTSKAGAKTATTQAKSATVSKKAAPKPPADYNHPLITLLKTDNKSMDRALSSGKSLADIAKANGVPEQQVIDLLVHNEKVMLDKEVATGKLTQAKEDEKLKSYPVQMKKVVEARHN